MKTDLDVVGKMRLAEAMSQLRIAKAMMTYGLMSQAAYEALRAWRSYMSYVAILNRDLISIGGSIKLRSGGSMPKKEWVMVAMPYGFIGNLVTLLGSKMPNIVELYTMASLIREYLCYKKSICGCVGQPRPIDDFLARGVLSKFISNLERAIRYGSKA